MEAGRRRRGHQPRRPQNQGGDRESTADRNVEPRVGVENQIGLVLTRMTDILERLIPQQGQGIEQVNQLGNQEIGEDRALEIFQKFFPPTFSGGPDPDIAENWLENIRNIFCRHQIFRVFFVYYYFNF